MTNTVEITTKYVTKIKRGNKPESKLITELYCVDENKLESSGEWLSKETIVFDIKFKTDIKYKTLSENGESALIKVETDEDSTPTEYYLKTVSNEIKEDNLGNLLEVE